MRILALSTLVCLAHTVSADILAIDLGSQFFKVALVQTGRFDIVHNLQSKRKTLTSVSFKNPIREFGDDAALASTRSPSKVVSYFRWLLGANTTAPDASLFPAHHVPGFAVSRNETTGSLLLGNEDFGHRSLEEIVAHILWYSKNLVEEHENGGKKGALKELTITVPSWATKREREAIIAAGNIAGFTKVALVHETSAATVQRGIDLELSNNGTSQVNALFLNMGSSHFESCVVQFGLASNVSSTHAVKVLGCAHSLQAGGIEITRKIAAAAESGFKSQFPKLASEFEKSDAAKLRLFKTAENVKQTLSANKETIFSIESLFDEKDYKKSFSRVDVEQFAAPVLEEIQKVVAASLTAANVSMSDIQQTEVIGSGWRIPCVESKLNEIVAPLPLGQHLNGDEAMVFGSAYIAANHSSNFRVKKILFTDISINEYSLSISPVEIPEGEESKWPRTQVIFPKGQKLNSVKQVKLTVDSDLNIDVSENGVLIEKFLVSGRNNGGISNATSQIGVRVKMDLDGVFSVLSADAVYEYMVEEEVVVEKKEETKEETVKEESANDDGTNEEAAIKESSETTETTPTTTTVMTPKKKKVHLTIEQTFEAKPHSMKQDQIKALKDQLKTIDAAEKSIKNMKKLKNDLEALIYSLRDKAESDSEVKEHSSETEREAVIAATKTAEEWFDDNGHNAPVDQLRDQIDALKEAMRPIKERIDAVKAQKLAEELEAKRKAQEEAEAERKRLEEEEKAKLQATLEEALEAIKKGAGGNETEETGADSDPIELPTPEDEQKTSEPVSPEAEEL